MTVLDEPVTDAKAGFSTICRRGDHKTCAMAKARCTCACHGAPQQSPAPRPKEAPAVSEATVTPLPSKPVAVPEHRCDECGYVAKSNNGLLIHRGRAHGSKKGGYTSSKPARELKAPPSGPAPGATRKAAPPAVELANERQVLAIVAQAYHDLNGADVSTCIDSAAAILDAITNADWRIVEA